MSMLSNAFPPRTLLIWGIALLAALWLALTAAGGVTQEGAPRVALSLYPKSGFAYQRNATAAMMASNTSLRDLRVLPGELADAREALRREPLATSALTLIGLDRAARGDRDGAVRIISRVHALDKRQLVANAWLIGHYGPMPGRSREVLGLLDEALKIRPELAVQYMPAFAQGLVDPQAIPVFQTLLRARPVWEDGFWRAVAANPAALPNAEVLRSRILAGPEQLGPVDALLMDAFVRARRMDLALSYAKSLPALPADADNLIRNSSFAEIPQMPPLDWELVNDGRISTGIDEGRGTLLISGIAGSGGVVARQLIALPPGTYGLLVKLGTSALTRGTDLNVRIVCAEQSGSVPAAVSEQLITDIDRVFAVPDTATCRFYWVEIGFSAMDSSGPAAASIAELRIVRSRARVEPQPVPAVPGVPAAEGPAAPEPAN